MMNTSKNALVLCSGGIDSVVTAFYVKNRLKYNKIKIIFFDYGQKSVFPERKYSKLCAKTLKAKFIEIKIPWLGQISNSLINKSGKIKIISKKGLKNTRRESEKFYVPCRNTFFIVYALAMAESFYIKDKNIWDIFLGFKCEGREFYPDTTMKFVGVVNKLSEIGCSKNFRIFAPLIKKDKEDVILLGKKLGVDFRKTFSCYVGQKKHCGSCLSCKLRQEGFYWTNVKDPTAYLT